MITMVRIVPLVLLAAVSACASDDADELDLAEPGSEASSPGATGIVTGRVTFAGSTPTAVRPTVTVDQSYCDGKVAAESPLVDPTTRGLANAVITIKGVQGGGDLRPAALAVSNKNCRFEPHVSVAVVGSTLRVSNQDPVLHTTHPYLGEKSLFNVPIAPAGSPVDRPLTQPGVLHLECDVHPWMSGWVVVHDNPYFAITGQTGEFRIPNVPQGTYVVQVWHEDLGTKSALLAVQDGATTLDFALDGAAEAKSGLLEPDPSWNALPVGLDHLEDKIPADNPMTPGRIALGRALFFEARLSSDDSVSCATCHDPRKGYSNGLAVGVGVGGQKGHRNVPTVINRRFAMMQFWDGRAASLEDQALGPIQNPVEMNLPLDQAIARLGSLPEYGPLFEAAFGSPDVTSARIAQALATFQRTLVSGNAPFDRYEAGDKSALDEAQARGLALFRGKARCSVCHTGFNMSDEKFHNVGVGFAGRSPDLGRALISRTTAERGAFRTPTLRDVAKTAPYFHDGHAKTLAEVISYYDRGGVPNATLDPNIKPLGLTADERKDLLAFLQALSGDDVVIATPPDPPAVTASLR